MRKLKLQVQMSVDRYIAGPNGEMDWMVWSRTGNIEIFQNGQGLIRINDECRS